MHRAWLVLGLVMGWAAGLLGQVRLPGATVDTIWNEQSVSLLLAPQVRVVLNAPAPAAYRDTSRTELVLYALPNGNTIEQTAGRQVREGMDWHFGIQHIAAQLRLLRRRDTTRTFVLAYLETEQKSWPLWRRMNPPGTARIRELVDTLRRLLPGHPAVTLAGHSGGGSFMFGFVNAWDTIPAYVDRFVFLDATYGFDTAEHHDAKLVEWLRASDRNALIVIAYDDRNIVLNGKPVIGPTGGTYRRSREMLAALRARGVRFEETTDSAITYQRSARPGVLFAIHPNPSNAILHTVLVERNGLLFGLSTLTPAQDRVGTLWGPAEYAPYVQP